MLTRDLIAVANLYLLLLLMPSGAQSCSCCSG